MFKKRIKFRKSYIEKNRWWTYVDDLRYIVVETKDKGFVVQIWDESISSDGNPVETVDGFRSRRQAFWAVRRAIRA